MYKGKTAFAALILFAVVAFHGVQGHAQSNYPSRPVKVIVAFPPGGAPDLIGRLLAQKLSERLGQQFIVENRTGAGGNIATEFVAKSAPDGYTLLIASDFTFAINPNVYAKIPFDSVKDFAPISNLVSDGFALLVCPTVQASSIAEFLALARSRPGQLSYASSGHGSNGHLAAEMLKNIANINVAHIPYRGFGQGVTDVLACNVEAIVGAISSARPHARAGKLKPLGVTTSSRHDALPGTPTFIESGFPGFIFETWFGLVAPAGTPKEIIDRVHAEVVRILHESDGGGRLREAGFSVVGSTPEEFAARIVSDLAAYAKIAKTVNVRLD